jgi:hypothetical protein
MNLNGILIGSQDPQRLIAYYSRLPARPWSKSPTSRVRPPEGWIATLADPDDNYFQLISPM